MTKNNDIFEKPLTKQQHLVFWDAMAGKDIQEIAKGRKISVKTVYVHKAKILKNAGVKTWEQLIIKYFTRLQQLPYKIVHLKKGTKYFYMGYYGRPNPYNKSDFPAMSTLETDGLTLYSYGAANKLFKKMGLDETWSIRKAKQ